MKFKPTEMEVPVITPSTMSVHGSWRLPTLYKETVNGLRQWSVRFDDETNELVMEHGLVDGKITESRHEIESNMRYSIEEAALINGKKRWQDQKDGGYLEAGEEAMDYAPPLAMLAQRMDKVPESQLKFPMFIQPKIDGSRMLAMRVPQHVMASGIQLSTRQRKIYHHLHHLEEDIKLLMSFLPTGWILDGELYRHGTPLNQLRSIIGSEVNLHEELHTLQYYLFDVIDTDVGRAPRRVFAERYMALINAYHQYIASLESKRTPIRLVGVTMVYDWDEAKQIRDEYIRLGYEGAILRSMKQIYEFDKRPHTLVKFIDHFTSEFPIVGYKEAAGKNKGAVIWQVQASNGEKFWVNPEGTLEHRRKLYQEADRHMGKLLMVRYLTESEYGVPRNGVGIAIRDYE